MDFARQRLFASLRMTINFAGEQQVFDEQVCPESAQGEREKQVDVRGRDQADYKLDRDRDKGIEIGQRIEREIEPDRIEHVICIDWAFAEVE